MARWSSSFIDELKTLEAGGGEYHPRFRLILGTHAFSADNRWHHFESTENIIVATSHYGTSSDIPFVDRILKAEMTLGNFSISPQSVTPRTWVYAAPQLRVDITQDLSVIIANYATPGALCELQVNVNGLEGVPLTGPGGITFGTTAQEWSTIFLGSFRNMTYSGGKCSLVCRGFYESSIGHPMVARAAALRGYDTERDFELNGYYGDYLGLASWAWFANVGPPPRSDIHTSGVLDELELREDWDGTASGLTLPAGDNGVIIDQSRGNCIWLRGFAQRRTQFGRFDGVYGTAADQYNPFFGRGAAVITPLIPEGSGLVSEPYYISYGDPDNVGTDQDLSTLTPTASTDTWVRDADDRTIHVKLGSFMATPAGSTINSRVVICGNPAIELATLLYSRSGWRCPWWTQGRLFNQHVHLDIIAWAEEQPRANISADELTIRSQTKTYCAVVEAPVVNGKAFLDSSFGPIGVFPVFKAGGVGVSVCNDIAMTFTSMTSSVVFGAEGLAEKRIGHDQIQMLNKIDFRAPQMATTYQRIEYTSEGKVDEAVASVRCDVGDEVRDRTLGGTASDPESPMYEFPAGTYNTVFPDLIANDFKRRCQPWLTEQYCQIELTLKGLEYAHLAPGDIVFIEVEGHGFDSGRTTGSAYLSLGIGDDYPCMIISHGVDWIKGNVKIAVLRWISDAVAL